MQKRDGWHLNWLLLLLLVVLLLGVAFAIALAQRENSTFANVSSIWGLFVGLVGFSVTIYTLFETQRVARKAQQEVEAVTVQAQQAIQKAAVETQEAVKTAQEQTGLMLERVRRGLREADFSTLLMWVRELRAAAGIGNWPRALLFAEECPAVAERLRNAEGLDEGERSGLREGADNLRLIQGYIRKHRLNTQETGLFAPHAESVKTLLELLERLGGRLHHESTRNTTP